MGKARPIRIDTRTFAKSGDAGTYFSNMLSRYNVGDKVNAADSLDLRALLKRHDEEVDKVGIGIDHFTVAAAPPPYPGKCFWIVRTDGSRIDFSLKNCLAAKPYD